MSSKPRPEFSGNPGGRGGRRVYRPAPGELSRWRLELVSALGDCRAAVLGGASEAHVKHRLEGILAGIDYRLEQGRRA
jgi:hypothetical protein